MQPIRVLVVDNYEPLRKSLVRALGLYEDIEVIGTAANGSEAIERCAQLRPHVVLMDIEMPGMNGIEATRMIRQRYPKTQVVILTLESNKPLIPVALQAGATNYLLKSASLDEIVNVIRSAYCASPSS